MAKKSIGKGTCVICGDKNVNLYPLANKGKHQGACRDCFKGVGYGKHLYQGSVAR